ncbi:MAG: hypothetical protein CL498_03495 [Actinobacteria bacterium]|nr:hypothetical protein [Actinomycetota bacterium]|tara:strand:- start:8159 stop:9391 length:1233 start_codon:yes stop_codon:yes gene_type:complete
MKKKSESVKLNQFLELYQDKESNKKLAKQKYPIGWQPHAEYDPKSNKGTLVSRGTQEQEPEFATLLLEWGFDPNEYEIVGNLQVRTWDMNMGGGETQQAWYYKADIRKKIPSLDTDYGQLLKEIKSYKPKTAPVKKGNTAFMYYVADWQMGKRDGKGSEGIVTKVLDSLTTANARLKELQKTGHKIDEVYVIGLGDIVENCNLSGWYSSQVWNTDLHLRDQITVARRLLWKIVKNFADQNYTVILSGVTSNHGQNRSGKQSLTTEELDNLDLQILEQVGDLAYESTYKNIKVVVPDSPHLLLEVKGYLMGFTHGHLTAGGGTPAKKIENWWKGQMFGSNKDGSNPVGFATCLIHGHYHHFTAVQQGGRTIMGVPAMSPSDDFQTRTGYSTSMGVVTMTVTKDGWDNLKIL